ncbi:glycosyltransferase [Chloroflexi bacterium TSY]|nr:glycosyltransferase [Chloroflexi bacterium TSY]
MSRDPITILYEIAQLGIGGAERQLYELVRRIDQERYRPLVFTLSEGGLYAELLADAHIPLCTFARRNRVDFIPVWRIAALIRKQNVRILHTYGYYAGLYARIAAIGVRPDVVISSERAIHSPGSLLGNSIYSALDRCLAPLTTGYIANAYAVKEYAAATKKLPEEKIHVVYNGIDLNRFRTSTATASVDSLAALGIRPSAKLVGFVARLDPIKNHPMFLHAIPQIVAAVPDAHFLIIGDGPMRSELEQLTHQLGLTDKVTFTGALKGDILIQFMASLEVSVLTSKREGCSNTVLLYFLVKA